MFNCDPIRSLTWALQRALERDLLGVRSPLAEELLGAPPGVGRRPREDECDVVLFGQVWSGDALGYKDDDSQLRIEQDTTVIVGPAQDACVYVSTQLLYHVQHPNRRFFLDVAAHSMVAKSEAGVYEGRDDAVTEAVDIEVGVVLARLHAEVKTGEPQRAALVAKYLHRCAAGFEAPLRDSLTDQTQWTTGSDRKAA
ncbi:MAG TPA: hypothetical protein VFP68_04370 [Burkholderiaceae bacterium]|nr:hypothetical protein [Burkholderiaceae bacterium]